MFYITGTDIARCLWFRFQAFRRPMRDSRKFEEELFMDLHQHRTGTDATIKEAQSPFLTFLYNNNNNNCVRTRKKQRVFYWYSVPHDRLMLDATVGARCEARKLSARRSMNQRCHS